ncbi:MAG: DUF4465 domain-containing protein [Bacteroidales bacterium]|nr:DUF4465 domain-containing protein [Bacteroidales bacterium]
MKKTFTLLSIMLAGAMSINAAQTIEVATFENLSLDPESAWYGDADSSISLFVSGTFAFNNYYIPDWASWCNFAFSNHTSTSFNDDTFMVDQFNSCVGHGVDNSEIFCVGYYGTYYAQTENQYPTVLLYDIESAQTVPGVYVTNAAYATSVIKGGNAYSPAFAEGDWFKLIVTALNDSTKTVEMTLAEWPEGGSLTMVEDWTWLSLEELGDVTGLVFTLETSQYDEYGPSTPYYFCLDNLGASNPESAISTIVATDPNAPVEYYNLQGVRVAADRLTPGYYIVKQGNNVKKTLIR